MTKLRHVILIAICIIVVSVVLPTAVAWVWNCNGDLDEGLYGAIGSWAGAIASTSAIAWALFLFYRERSRERTRAGNEQNIAQGDADDVRVQFDARPGQHKFGGNWTLKSVDLVVTNESMQPIYLRRFNAVAADPKHPFEEGKLVGQRLLGTGETTTIRFAVAPHRPLGESQIEPSAVDSLGDGEVEFQQGLYYWTKTTRDATAKLLGSRAEAQSPTNGTSDS